MGQYPHELSGGLRQRVMIAMALMANPQLIIADEPTTALDVTVQAELLRLLKDLQTEFGMGLVLITHDLGVVSRIADRVAVMYAGQIVETGDTESLFNRPMHPYTIALMRCLPSSGGDVSGRLPTIPGVVPSLIGRVHGCRFRERCSFARSACADDVDLSVASTRDTSHARRCILNPEELLHAYA